ncbi:quinone oxidoreductase [Halenospora varia]|nr:quinone oxidoreductase [Halenospora varia]
MKGVAFHSIGDSSVLTLDETLDIPVSQGSDVLIKLEYAGVNFIDTYQRSGLYPIKLPATAGREGAGVIVQLGPELPESYDLHVGDKVAVFAQGTMAQYVCAPGSGVLKLPSSVTTKTGAAGQVILVQAAAGGTGGLLVQMCKYLGATVIGTVSTSRKAEIAKNHHCDHLIIYTEQNVESEVMRLTDGKGCHAVFSGIGQATFTADLACTRRKGTLVSYGNSSGPVVNVNILELSKKNVKLVRPTLANYIAERDEFVERSQKMLELVDVGALKIGIGGEYDLESLRSAQDDLTGAKSTGKLIVKIDS